MTAFCLLEGWKMVLVARLLGSYHDNLMTSFLSLFFRFSVSREAPSEHHGIIYHFAGWAPDRA